MIQDFPLNIRIRLAQLIFCSPLTLISLCPVSCLSLGKLHLDSQQGTDLATLGRNKKKSIGPILFLYYEESLVSSDLNSKQFRFHGVRPNVSTWQGGAFLQAKTETKRYHDNAHRNPCQDEISFGVDKVISHSHNF